MSEVTVAIVTHVQRRTEAMRLVSTVAQYYPTTIAEDDGRLGCDLNHIQAWELLCGAESPWALVLEDDAVLCNDFDYHLGSALFSAPGPIVSLYLGTGRPVNWQRRAAHAVATGRPWIIATELLHCVAVCVATELIPDMGRVALAAISSPAEKRIDEAITEWVRRECLPVSYTNPSLVNHADNGSLAIHHYPAGRPQPGARVAHSFGTRDSWTGELALM